MAYSDPALFAAAAHGRTNEVMQLLGKGDDIQETTRSGDSALHGAVLGGHGVTVLQLLHHGAHLNLTNNSGDTPLHLAGQRGGISMVHILLKNDANVLARNSSGKTPENLAAACGHTKVAALLRRRREVITQGLGKGNSLPAFPAGRKVAGKGKSAEEAEEAELSGAEEGGQGGWDAPAPVRNVDWCQLGNVRGEFREGDALNVVSIPGASDEIEVVVTSTKFLQERSVIQITSTGPPQPLNPKS